MIGSVEIHSSDDCQEYWRDRFSQQLQECIDAPWSDEYNNSEQAKWFREGIKYAMMVIRWDYDEKD